MEQPRLPSTGPRAKVPKAPKPPKPILNAEEKKELRRAKYEKEKDKELTCRSEYDRLSSELEEKKGVRLGNAFLKWDCSHSFARFPVRGACVVGGVFSFRKGTRASNKELGCRSEYDRSSSELEEKK